MEQELEIFDRGERLDYEIFGAVLEFFKNYPNSYHHPKEDIIYEKFKTVDPKRAASISDLQAEHWEGARRWKGSLLDTDNGKTYSRVITLVGADGLSLKGCALGIICEGETWRRAK